MMRSRFVRVSLLLVIVTIGGWLGLSTGSPQPAPSHVKQDTSYQQYQKQLSKLLIDYEAQVMKKQNLLMEQGKKAFAEELARSEERYYKSLLAYEEQLTDEAEKIRVKLKERYAKPILNIELRLAMVTLTAQERRQLETQLTRMNHEFKVLTEEYQEELEQKLLNFQVTEEEKEKEAMANWEQEYEARLAQEFDNYVKNLDKDLRKDREKLEETLRRAVLARE